MTEPKRTSPLDQEYADRGLMRVGQAAHYLEVDRDRLENLMRAGALAHVSFERKSKVWHGIPVAEVERLKAQMEQMRP